MFKPIQLCLLLSITLFLFSCKKSKGNFPESVGKLGTLVIVAGPEVQKAVSAELDQAFLQADESITGGSPFSELLKPDPDEFHQFFSNQKTILVLVTESSQSALSELLEGFSEAEMKALMETPALQPKEQSDLFAKHQHVVYLFAKDEADLKNKLKQGQQKLKQLLVELEIKDQYAKLYDTKEPVNDYSSEMKKELGMGFKVPKGFKLIEHRDGFWWFEQSMEDGNNSRKIGLMAHAYPMRDSMVDMSYSSICAMRDSVIKYHIKGEIKGTYMGTSESDAYPARHRDLVKVNSYPAIKVRGWWNIDGIMMSGPFIRYVMREPGSNRIFAFEGFIYKPNLNVQEKDLRIIESIALSIQ